MIGALRHQVELLQGTRTQDGGGGAALVWTVSATLWADVERLSSTPDFAGDRNVRLARREAVVRRRSDLAIGGRLRFQGVDYQITSIEDADTRGTKIALICEEVLT